MERLEKICLIIPPSVFLLDERVFMSLGLLKVAAVLEANFGKPDVIDLSGIANFEEALKDYILSNSDVFVFGITATTPQMPAVAKITKVIKEYNQRAKIILGGPHVTLTNAAFKNEAVKGFNSRATKAFQELSKNFDVLIAGDGELAIFEAIAKDKGIVDADDPKSNLFLTTSLLNSSPFPARHLIEADSYHYFIDGERAMSLIAQLGCPYGCGFCGGRKSPSFRKARMRSTEQVVAEVEFLHQKYGVKGFMFYDDELNVNPQKFIQLMDKISELQDRIGEEFRLRGFVRSNLFSEEQAKVMYRAGFRWLLVGFESGSERMLRNMGKRATIDDNTRAVEAAKKAGLKVKALMSIGHPGESGSSIMETHKWLFDVKPDDFDVTIITVYPGTGYYDEAFPHVSKKGVWVYSKNNDNLYSLEVDYLTTPDYYKGDPEGGYRSYVFTDYLTPEEIVSARDFLEKDVRQKLGIPFNPSAPARRYEHSMGMGLPSYILRG